MRRSQVVGSTQMPRGVDLRLDRRAFLTAVLSSLGAQMFIDGYGGAIVGAARPPQPIVDLRALIDAYYGGQALEAAARVGGVAWEGAAGARDALRARVATTEARIALQTGIATAVRFLDRVVADDFAALRLHPVAGWQLAATEADLCILAWKMSGKGRSVGDTAELRQDSLARGYVTLSNSELMIRNVQPFET